MNERFNIEKDEKMILHQNDDESHTNKVISTVEILEPIVHDGYIFVERSRSKYRIPHDSELTDLTEKE